MKTVYFLYVCFPNGSFSFLLFSYSIYDISGYDALHFGLLAIRLQNLMKRLTYFEAVNMTEWVALDCLPGGGDVYILPVEGKLNAFTPIQISQQKKTRQ